MHGSFRSAPQQFFARLSAGLVIYTLVIIAWGAFVRFSGSGDGCGTHWPLCQGYFVPQGESALLLQTWIEFAHRAKSGLLGFLIFIQGFLAFRLFPKRHPVRYAALGSIVFMITEALLGAWLVLAGLVDQNASNLRIFAVGLHSVNTLFLLAFLSLTFVWAHPRIVLVRPKNLSISLIVISIVGFIGVAVAGSLASLSNTLYPSDSLAGGLSADFASESPWFVRVRLLHPFLAVSIAGFLISLSLQLRDLIKTQGIESLRRFYPALVIIGIVLGATTLLTLSPLGLRLLHLCLADLIWISLIALLGSAFSSHEETPNSHP